MTNLTPIPVFPDTTPPDRSQFLRFHAIPLFIAWNVILPVSIMIVRYGSVWKKWFPIHVVLVVVSVVASLIAGSYGFIESNRRNEHFVNPHQYSGVALLILMLIQVAFGATIALLYNSDRPRPRVLESIHRWWGRMLILLSFVTIFLGMLFAQMDVWMYLAVGVLQIVLTTVYCIMMVYL
jgi:glucan phosphoethanolaminetransferase (alkaline phosphatase superfamily)